jgi:cardiolipin synthase
MLNLPNFLTLVRILTIPVFLILLMSGRPGAALVLFIFGGVTDALDGAIARLTDSKTELGAVLDPLADKLLLLSSFCVLALLGAVPNWLTVLVIIRDVILLAGYFTLFVVSGERIAVRPSVIGKATTFFQLASVTVVLIGFVWPGAAPAGVRTTLFLLAGTTTTVSGLHYMVRGLSWLQQRGTPAAPGPGAGGSGSAMGARPQGGMS